MPTTRADPPASRGSVPPTGKPRPDSRALRTTSPVSRGNRPDVSGKSPAVIGLRRSSSVAAGRASPMGVRTETSPSRISMTLVSGP